MFVKLSGNYSLSLIASIMSDPDSHYSTFIASHHLLLTSVFPAVKQQSLHILQHVLCDGSGMLITFPFVWRLNDGIVYFVECVSSIGMLCVVLAMCAVWSRVRCVSVLAEGKRVS